VDFKQIKPAVNQYLKKLKKEFPIEEVILFGSFAEGRAKKNSDVDLIILSKGFSKMKEDERLKFLYRRAVGFPYDLHAYGFTPKEFYSATPLTTVGQIKNTGVRIL